MSSVWFLVADRSRARILGCTSESALKWANVTDLVHPEAKLKEREVRNDRQGGFSVGKQGGTRSTSEPHPDFKHETAEVFSRQVVDYLERSRNDRLFEKLVVVAPPLFLGELRKQFSNLLGQMVSHEVDKDLSGLPEHELKQRLSVIHHDIWGRD